MPTTVEALAALAAALGIGTILPDAVRAAIRWMSDRGERERKAANRLESARRQADRRADLEAAYRRLWQEYGSELRGRLLEAGHKRDDLPPVPRRPSDDRPSTD